VKVRLGRVGQCLGLVMNGSVWVWCRVVWVWCRRESYRDGIVGYRIVMVQLGQVEFSHGEVQCREATLGVGNVRWGHVLHECCAVAVTQGGVT